jgi:flagellar M-ring protein FliF
VGNLVARAVEGMDESDVVIVDSLGKILSKNSNDSLSQMSASQIEFKTRLEGDLEKRVEDMLSRVVGDGRVVARVAADLDFSTVKETKTSYDSDGAAVRSQSKNTQSMEGSKPIASGLPGAQTNSPLVGGAPSSVKVNDTKTSNETTNYELPQTVVQTARSPGSLKRLSIAVMVDGKPTKVKKEDGTFESKTEPWSAEKMKEIEAIVASAVGLDRKRGDTIEIKNMEFSTTDFSEAEAMLASKERAATVQQLVLYGIVALLIIMFFAFVVRPFIRWVTDNTTEGVETFLPQTLEELEKMQKNSGLPGLEDAVPAMPDQLDPDKIESEMVKEKVVSLVDQNPHKAALILKDWLTAEKASGPNDGEKGEADAV